MTLKGAQKKLKENKEATIHNFEIIKRLQTIKEELLNIKTQLEL